MFNEHLVAAPDDLAQICREFQIRRLGVFGSVLGEDFRPDSDIDMLVDFLPQARVTAFKLFAIQAALERLVGRKVDLVPRAGLKPVIRDAVLAAERVLYEA